MDDSSSMYSGQNISVSFETIPKADKIGEGIWYDFDPEATKYLSVPALLEGLGVRGVIDTGATRSVVSPKLIARTGMKPSGATCATMFTACYSVPLYRAMQLRAGAASVSDLDVACHDLAMLEAAFPGECPILIGRDVLTRAVLECQFSRGRARIAAAFPPEEATGHARLEFTRSRHGLPIFQTQLEDLQPQPAVLDLGSNLVCSMSEQYAAEAGLLSRPVSTTMTAGLEGSIVGRQFTLGSLKFADYVLHDVPACVIPNWSLDAPINLGWPAFAAFDLVFEFDRDLYIRADEDRLALPLLRDRSGIGAQRFPDHLLVRHVALGSPAHEQGMIAGDRIVAIDGLPVDVGYPVAGKRFGRQAAGTRISLTLEVGREIDLVLKDYF